ncbi:MAG: D-alanine--D-alanine ligase [Parcubacteria group bacterium]|nr:D-alanine--D-alanine ligase [Parcubacteria group bacterium]
MSTIRVGVVRGGPSSEYDVSLKTGASVLQNLPERYAPVDILISKNGEWHAGGLPTRPEKILPHVDVVFNALHGAYGEDGIFQQMLEAHGVPYTGSDSLASAIGMNKVLARKRFAAMGMKVPYGMELQAEAREEEEPVHMDERFVFDLFRRFPQPSVVKPISAGSSVGVRVAHTLGELSEALEYAFSFGDTVLIEEYIRGREATCGVVDDFRGHDTHALLPIEIIKPQHSRFFDYQAKYGGESQEICPSPNFSQEQKQMIEKLAVQAHRAIGARHYSRSDFIISPRGVYILEINTLPGLTSESLLPKSLAAGGTQFEQFLDHILTLAMR